MAIKKWGDRLFLDGQMVTRHNVESYISKTKEQLAALEEHRKVINENDKNNIDGMIRIETIGGKDFLVAQDYCQEITKENVEDLYKEINAMRTKLLTEGMMPIQEKSKDLEDYDNDYE